MAITDWIRSKLEHRIQPMDSNVLNPPSAGYVPTSQGRYTAIGAYSYPAEITEAIAAIKTCTRAYSNALAAATVNGNDPTLHQSQPSYWLA